MVTIKPEIARLEDATFPLPRLRALAVACGNCYAFGVVLYDSTGVVTFGDRPAAMPLSCL